MESYTQLPLIASTKHCKVCGIDKPLSEFYSHSSAKDGLRNDCKSCFMNRERLRRAGHQAERAERERLYRKANLPRIRERERHYWETHKAERNERSRAYYATHKDVLAQRQRLYREPRKAEACDRTRRWYECNPDRAKVNRARYLHRRRNVAVNDLTTTQWREVLAYFDHHCAYCGKHFDHLTMDHMIPVSRGGFHTIANIVPACQPCNSTKHDKNLAEFLLYGGV